VHPHDACYYTTLVPSLSLGGSPLLYIAHVIHDNDYVQVIPIIQVERLDTFNDGTVIITTILDTFIMGEGSDNSQFLE